MCEKGAHSEFTPFVSLPELSPSAEPFRISSVHCLRVDGICFNGAWRVLLSLIISELHCTGKGEASPQCLRSSVHTEPRAPGLSHSPRTVRGTPRALGNLVGGWNGNLLSTGFGGDLLVPPLCCPWMRTRHLSDLLKREGSEPAHSSAPVLLE